MQRLRVAYNFGYRAL